MQERAKNWIFKSVHITKVGGEHSKKITTLEIKVASGCLSGGAPSVQVSGDSSSGSQNPDLTKRVTNLLRTADHNVLLVDISSVNCMIHIEEKVQ